MNEIVTNNLTKTIFVIHRIVAGMPVAKIDSTPPVGLR